ncbi:MAG: hypothetical protein IJ419_14945 [Agathobacter sp.]|nr:hypothetical protein [Agathobacter sp.]
MKTMKKFFASFLVLCMVLTMPNIAANAEDATPISLGESVTTSLEEGDSVGKVYSYTIPSDVEGTYMLTVDVSAATEGKYWQVDLENSTNYAYSSGQAVNNEYSSTMTASVKGQAGDVITITVKPYAIYEGYDEATQTSIFTYNAVNVTWSVSGKAVGTESSPEEMAIMDNYGNYAGADAIVAAGGDGYYYTFTAPADGNLGIYLNLYNCNPMDMDELKPEIILTNKNTNEVVKYSDGLVKVAVASMWGTSTYEVVQIPVTTGDEIVMQVKSGATTTTTATVSWASIITGEAGSSNNPIFVDTSYSKDEALEVTIPAGEIYSFAGDDSLEGCSITISGADYTLSFFGNDPETIPENGVYESGIQLMRGQLSFTIENTSDADKTYTIYITAPLGSESNPEEIVIAEGEETGSKSHVFTYADANWYSKYKYIYKYVATKDGYVRVTISGDDGSTRPTYPEYDYDLGADVDVTVEGEVWHYVAYNTVEDGDYVTDFSKVEEEGDVVTNGQLIEVKAGDVVIIELQAMDVVTGMWVDSTIAAEVEYVTPDAGSVENAIGAIENTEEGDEAAVEIVLKDAEGNATMVIPADVLAALKDKNISAVITNDFYSWVINGKDIETPEALDLTINFDTTNIPEALVNKALGDAEGGQFSLADNADFGLIAALVFSIADEYEGEDFSLFYYNADGNLECVGNDVVEDGLLAFAFEHASDYVLMQGDVEEGTIVAPDVENPPAENPPADEPDMPDKGDMANMMVYVIVLMGAALVVAGFVAKKRFA